MLNIGEAFRAQQFVGDILGSDADAGVSNEADCRCLGRSLLRQPIRTADQTHGRS